jgi:hypothetical protein
MIGLGVHKTAEKTYSNLSIIEFEDKKRFAYLFAYSLFAY